MPFSIAIYGVFGLALLLIIAVVNVARKLIESLHKK